MITPDPRGHTWDSWCPLMAELYATYGVGAVPETEWRPWAQRLSIYGGILKSGMPQESAYQNWQEWAEALTGVITVKAGH